MPVRPDAPPSDALDATPDAAVRPGSSPDPLDAIEAVTHPDPWSWYHRLAGHRVHLDDRTGCWIVARPDDVAAVLVSPDVTVRPVEVPVPPHLEGTPVGELVSGMMRWRDGDRHRPLRWAIEPLFTSVAPPRLDAAIDRAAALLDRSTVGVDDAALVASWTDRFPAATTAALLDAPEVMSDELVTAAIALARTCAPGASPATVPAALDAVATIDRCWPALSATRPVAEIGRRLAPTAPDVVRANVVGCLVQSVDACAGAIASVLERRLTDPSDWHVLVASVLAATPPVHNTRRWTQVELRLPSGTVPAGAEVLVVLATGTEPGRGFGAGVHRCPARGLVPTIVRAAAAGVWNRLRDPGASTVIGRRPSPNVRIAELTGARP